MNKKISFDVKYQAVQEYLNKKASIRDLSKYLNCNESSIRQWISIYKSIGAVGLQHSQTKKQWTDEIKLAAITEYLSKQGSLWDICKKYKISHHNILKRWIMVYNSSHNELSNTTFGGNRVMAKARKTTFDERVTIVQFCIANNKNYTLTIEKYDVSYQQIYLWVRKYEDKGIDGLIDRRGKSKQKCDITDTDRLKIQNKLLEAENKRLEMEVNVLKKLEEVERRRR